MGMSDCSVCLETPCSCGSEYKDWTADKIKDHIEMLTNLLKEKESKRNEKNNGFPTNRLLKKELQRTYDDLIKSLNDGTFIVDSLELGRLKNQGLNCKDQEFLDKLSDIVKKAGLSKPE